MLRRRAMCSVAKKLLREDGAELWRRGQDGKVGPELFTQLEAARRGSQEVRSNLAVMLAARWHVDQVAAQKKDENIVATYALRVKQRDDPREDQPDVDVGLLRASIWPEGPDGIKTALLFSLQSDPALPLGLAAYPLIAHARKPSPRRILASSAPRHRGATGLMSMDQGREGMGAHRREESRQQRVPQGAAARRGREGRAV